MRAPPEPAPAHPPEYELNAAEGDLRKALSLDPSLAEAYLRLGHVLGEQGRHGDAAAALVGALAMPGLTVDLQYDGWLLLGRERDALDDVSGARDALARAAALVPGAQSPHLALSQIARASGDRKRAVEALQSLSTDPNTDDPWWTYTRAHAPTAEALLTISAGASNCREGGGEHVVDGDGDGRSRARAWISVSSAQMQTFTSRADVVLVDALVTEGRTPVAGLGRDDFELRDNGVPQTIALVNQGQVPLGVVLAMDTSGSVSGARLGVAGGGRIRGGPAPASGPAGGRDVRQPGPVAATDFDHGAGSGRRARPCP